MRVFVRLLFLLLSMLPASAWAAASPWQHSDELSVRLISGTEGTEGQAEIMMGLELQLAEGWHTYWRSPGDAGMPPSFDTGKSKNLETLEVLYPLPIRYSAMGMDTIGYKGRLILPLKISLKEAGQPLNFNARLDLLICSDLCLPKTFSLSLDLPATGGATHSTEYHLIEKALERVPATDNPSLQITDVIRNAKSIHVKIKSEQKLREPDVLIESDKNYAFSPPKKQVGPTGQTATFVFDLLSDLTEGESLAALPLTLTAIDGDNAIEQRLTPDQQRAQPLSGSSASTLPFWCILLLALVGGFILNLMPCVLPVLSLKIMALIRHGGSAHHTVRHSFLSTAGGIVFSFLALALVTIVLKTTGQAIGWGVQFQQPLFLVFMIALLTFFAANLWGFFEIGIPHFIQDLLDPQHHPKLAGDFATGALATLLATPCSAPFLGTAVAFAMAAGWVEILSVFLALGLGMCLPYLAVALWPRLATSLPKPGAWMLTLARVLGFGLAGTAVWLLVILGAQMGRNWAILVSLAMIAILLQLFLRHKNILRFLTMPVIAFALLGSCGAAYMATAPSSQSPQMGAWQSFDEETLARHLREGKTVFVDVTADWCLTCKVNKRFTLTREDVQKRLFGHAGVVALQADWTNPNPAASAFLNKHERYGIPFNIVFGPQAPKGIALPEILTPRLVIEAIDRAQGPSKACPVDLPEGTSC